MRAALVYDNKGIPIIPVEMGQPSPDQLTGTTLENLAELAFRICYDILGKGRSSINLHKHILEVNNTSVYEHCVFTVKIEYKTDLDLLSYISSCLNKKGVYLIYNYPCLEITANFRAVLEWDINDTIGKILYFYAKSLAPRIFTKPVIPPPINTGLKTKNLNYNQAWITLWLSGSRGFSHEQVRHRYAVSQRSTRYVDESESPYIIHPLIEQFLNDETVDDSVKASIREVINRTIDISRHTYTLLEHILENYGRTIGADKLTARKQARGAARGYLGNALETQMLFSAPISGWLNMLKQRFSLAADGEIRAIYVDVLKALQSSQYASYFPRTG